MKKKKYTFIDLFAGAGGLSEGFVRAGFTPIAHIEMDKYACETLKTRAAFHYLEEKGIDKQIIVTELLELYQYTPQQYKPILTHEELLEFAKNCIRCFN